MDVERTLEVQLEKQKEKGLSILREWDPLIFLSSLLEQKLRSDGRTLLESRSIAIQKGVISSQSFGSSLVEIGFRAVNDTETNDEKNSMEVETDESEKDYGSASSHELFGTKVLGAISLEVGTPSMETPNAGQIEVNINLANSRLSKQQQLDATYLESIMMKVLLTSRIVNLQDLCIIPYKAAWKVTINIDILSHDGNLMDCIWLCIMSSLTDTKLPGYSIKNSSADDNMTTSQEPNFASGEALGDGDNIEIAIDLNKKRKKLPLHRIIIPASFGLIHNLQPWSKSMSSSTENKNENINTFEEGKSVILVDPSLEEEVLPSVYYSPLTIMIDENGKICCLEKRSGNVSLTPTILSACTKLCKLRLLKILPLLCE